MAVTSACGCSFACQTVSRSSPVATSSVASTAIVWRRGASAHPFSGRTVKVGGRRHVAARPVTAQVAQASRGVREVNINTYDAAVAAAGNKLVVLDMYTQWCGPCKLIAPKLAALSEKYSDVVFLKLDCNQENKPLAKSLGVRVVPTFKLIRNKEIIHEIAGAKYDELVEAIVKNHPLGASAPLGKAAPMLVEGKVVEVDKGSFYPALQEAGSRLVVLDMFTDWCGPCKLLAPKLDELASQNNDIVFLKLNCNEENKPLAKGLGIVSVPTVKFFKSQDLLSEVRGFKLELILEKVAEYR